MKSRLSFWVLLAGGCLLACGWLSTGVPNAALTAPAHADPVPAKADPKLEETVAQLQTRVNQLEKGLRALGRDSVFPGLLPRPIDSNRLSPEELAPLRLLAEVRLQTWRQVHAKYLVGSPGGSVADEARARTLFFVAMARLAWAEQRDPAALEHLEDAANAAEHMIRAEQAGYDEGLITLDVLLESQGIRAEILAVLARAGGKLPEAKCKPAGPWKLPPGPMPEPYPGQKTQP